MVGIEDVLDPDDVSIYRAAAGGVTTANVLHGSANPIGGKNAVIKMRYGADGGGLLMEGAPPGIKFALGENVIRDRTPTRYPNTRMGQQDVIRRAFIDAQEYMAEWERYEQARARGETVIPPRKDQKLEALAEVVRGERLVHAHSYRGDEILQLIRTAEEFGIRIATFQHVLEGYKVADEIAAHGAGASTFSDWWAYKMEAYDAIPYNAALMTERGVTVSINSDSGEEMRHLNQEAAKAMRWGGLDEHQALALVTLNPARQLGIDDRVGSLEVGKDADLVIYNGHPLSVFSSVDQTMIDGKIYFDREMDRERQGRMEAEKEALLAKHRGGARGRPITDDGASDRSGGAR
jgi:imidazolonepropionase-like amidohydrolase